MVADDLVELNQLGRVLLEPVGEALVELGAGRLRKRLVGGVTDQEVAKTECVVAGEQGLLGANEILADERHQPAVDLSFLRRQRNHRAAVEHMTLNGASLQHTALGIVELVEPRREQRLNGRRNGDLSRSVPVAAVGEHREHLADEERVAAGCLEDPLAQPRVDLRAGGEPLDQLLRLVRRERLEQDVGGVELAASPGRPAVEQFRTRHAEQQDRCVATEVGDVLDQVEKDWLSPVQIIEHDDERTSRRGGLEELAYRPGDLLGRARERLAAENRVERACGGGLKTQLGKHLVGGRPEQLLDGRGHGPVADAFAVGKAAAADHGRAVEARQELGHEARFADPGRAEDREQMARSFADDVREGIVEEVLLALPAHHWNRLPHGLRHPGNNAEEAEGRHRLGFAL